VRFSLLLCTMLRGPLEELLLRLTPRFPRPARTTSNADAPRTERVRETRSGAAADLNVRQALERRRLRTRCAAATRPPQLRLRRDVGMMPRHNAVARSC
jgi:hypothetical protein